MSTPSEVTQALITAKNHNEKDQKRRSDNVSSEVTPVAAASMAAVGRAGQVSVYGGGQEQIVGEKNNQWCLRVYPKSFFAPDYDDPQPRSPQSAFYFFSTSLKSNTAIKFLSLADNVLTIFFAKEDSDFEPGFYIGDRRDFIRHFLDAYPFCQEMEDHGPISQGVQDHINGKGKARFDNYSATLAKLSFSYHRAEVIEAFLNDLKMRYAVPLDIVENIKKHIVPKKETDEEREFYKDTKALKLPKEEKEKNNKKSAEFQARAILLEAGFEKWAEKIRDEQLKQLGEVGGNKSFSKKEWEESEHNWLGKVGACYTGEIRRHYEDMQNELYKDFLAKWESEREAEKMKKMNKKTELQKTHLQLLEGYLSNNDVLYYLAKRGLELNARTWAYNVFGLIKKESIYYKSAQFQMGKLFFNAWKPKLTGDPKYHPRAIRHLLLSTAGGFEFGLENLVPKDLQHSELTRYMKEIKASFEEAINREKRKESQALAAAAEAKRNMNMKLSHEMEQLAVQCGAKIKYLASILVEKPQAGNSVSPSASALAPAPILMVASAAAKAAMTASLASAGSAVSVESVDSGAAAPANLKPPPAQAKASA